MSNPTIPVAPGERVTVVTSRPLYFNRYVGHATRRQNERQAIGGDDVPVTLIAVGRTRSSRPATGTLEADGHVGVAPGLVVQLYDLTLDVVDQSLPSATTDAGIEARLDALGYRARRLRGQRRRRGAQGLRFSGGSRHRRERQARRGHP
jgi:hypothetical protein